jgi:dihydrofolate reductase
MPLPLTRKLSIAADRGQCYTHSRTMNPTATVYIATSLDGFIAREDGGLDWLPPIENSAEGDYGFSAFFESVDALVMGRNTCDVVRAFDKWPYGHKPVIVLTHRPLDGPTSPAANVQAMSATPQEIIARLASQGAKHLYIDGGQVIQQFLAAGLIDRLIISRIPILLGRGIPLFGPVPQDIPLRHVRTQSYPSGLVQSEYAILTSRAEKA